MEHEDREPARQRPRPSASSETFAELPASSIPLKRRSASSSTPRGEVSIAEQATGYPGYDFVIGVDNATIGAILADNGYATSWFGKNHNTPDYQYSTAGPFGQWPTGMGFEYFYGFMGGETDQWTPFLFRNTTQIFPWRDHPERATSSLAWRMTPSST